MPGLRRHAVTVPGRAGGGIADAAGGQHHCRHRIELPLSPYALNCSVFDFKRLSAVPDELHPQRFEPPLQGRADVERPVTDREHAVSPLRFQRNAELFKKGHGIRAGKPGKHAVEELAVLRNIVQQLLIAAVVRHVATALAGNVQFFSQALIRLQQRHMAAVFRRRNGRHHTGSAAADHDYLSTHHPSSQTRHTGSTDSPAWKRFLPHPFPSALRFPPAAR